MQKCYFLLVGVVLVGAPSAIAQVVIPLTPTSRTVTTQLGPMGESPAGTLVASRHSLDVAVWGFNPGVRLNVFLTLRTLGQTDCRHTSSAESWSALTGQSSDFCWKVWSPFSRVCAMSPRPPTCLRVGALSVKRTALATLSACRPCAVSSRSLVDSFTSAFDVDGVSGH